MADKTKKTEAKLVLEREYIVPLRRGWLKVPKHRRANKAVKTLKEFLARHMKVYDRDLKKIKIDELLNNELRFRGMKKPPAKIKVKAKKFDDGIVRVELVNLPEHVKFAKLKAEKKSSEIEKKVKEKEEEKEEKVDKEAVEEEKEKKEEKEEKEESSKEEGMKLAKEQAKQQKHVAKNKEVIIRRRALSR